MALHVTIGSIILNEEEFIEANLRQHYEFADKIVIVEGADQLFPKQFTTQEGLSIDRTAEIIRSFPDPDHKITFIQHGFAKSKAQLRNEYAKRAPEGILIAVDADEFLTKQSMRVALEIAEKLPVPGVLRIPHIHLWKNPRQFITGGYYDVPHNRIYRWPDGARYDGYEHNHPTYHCRMLHTFNLTKIVFDGDFSVTGTKNIPLPYWIHYGFCRSADSIFLKNAYYVARGEAETRPETTRDRAAWFQEGIPKECKVHKWHGPYPEVFREEKT